LLAKCLLQPIPVVSLESQCEHAIHYVQRKNHPICGQLYHQVWILLKALQKVYSTIIKNVKEDGTSLKATQ